MLQSPCTDDPVVRTEYPLSPYNHEEFDTRVVLYAANASSQGYKRILIVAMILASLSWEFPSFLRLVQRNYIWVSVADPEICRGRVYLRTQVARFQNLSIFIDYVIDVKFGGLKLSRISLRQTSRDFTFAIKCLYYTSAHRSKLDFLKLKL